MIFVHITSTAHAFAMYVPLSSFNKTPHLSDAISAAVGTLCGGGGDGVGHTTYVHTCMQRVWQDTHAYARKSSGMQHTHNRRVVSDHAKLTMPTTHMSNHGNKRDFHTQVLLLSDNSNIESNHHHSNKWRTTNE